MSTEELPTLQRAVEQNLGRSTEAAESGGPREHGLSTDLHGETDRRAREEDTMRSGVVDVGA